MIRINKGTDKNPRPRVNLFQKCELVILKEDGSLKESARGESWVCLLRFRVLSILMREVEESQD